MTALLPPPPPAAHVTVFRAKDPAYVAVFVEGPDDFDTWKHWLKWAPYPVGGCAVVRAAIDTLRATGTRGYVGIIDADCNRLEGTQFEASDLIVTEAHDLECDLLQTGALDRLLGGASISRPGLAALVNGGSFRDALLARAEPFGLVRWHFFRRGLEYDDGRLSPFRFVDKATLRLDEHGLLGEAAAVLHEAPEFVAQAISDLRAASAPAWHVCNGHDLLAILTLALQGPLQAKATYPNPKAVGNALRLAVDTPHRNGLHVWRALLQWQEANPTWVACAP